MNTNETDATVARLTAEKAAIDAVAEQGRTPAQTARAAAIAKELEAARVPHTPARP